MQENNKMAAYTEQEIIEKLGAIRGWVYLDGKIQKTYSFADFDKSMEYVNQLAMIIKNQDHHPDIHIRFTKVTIASNTHVEDGITEKDFKLAKACDQLAVDMM
jgi:4a-hydroxytetrahydrobiopterin dehydratase